MSSRQNSRNLLTNVFRPSYVYDGCGFRVGVSMSNVSYLGADTVTAGTLALGDGGGNIYIGSNSGTVYTVNETNRNNVALGVGAAGNISYVSNSVFIGSNAGSALTDATDTTIIGTNNVVTGTRNVLIGNRSIINGDRSVVIGSDLCENRSYRLNIGNLILGDISLGGQLEFNSAVRINGTLSAAGVRGDAIDTSNIVVPGYLRNTVTAGQSVVMDISGGRFKFSGSGESVVSDVSFNSGRIHAPSGIRGTGYDLSSALSIPSGTVTANNFISSGTSSNYIGGVTISNGDISYNGVIVGATNKNNVIGGVVLSNNTVSNSGTTTSSSFTTPTASSNSIGGVILNNNTVSNSGTTTSSSFTTPTASSNSIGGVILNNNTVSNSGTTTSSNFISGGTSSNYIGGVTINNGDISYNGVITGAVNKNNVIGGVTLSNSNALTGSGTASAPSHTFSTDGSMGMYLVGTNALGFSVGGSNRMTICGDKIGIGLTNPSYLFEVSNSSNTNQDVRITGGPGNVTDSGGAISFSAGQGGSGGFMSRIKGVLSNAVVGSEEQGGIAFQTRPSGSVGQSLIERMRIGADGNVGIGTTRPGYTLDVSGILSVGYDLNFSRFLFYPNPNTLPNSTSNSLSFASGYNSPNSGRILFGDGTGWKMHIGRRTGATTTDLVTFVDSGNVGIGITTPTNTLDISTTNAYGLGVRGTNYGGIQLGRIGDSSGAELIYDGTSTKKFVIRGTTGIPITFEPGNSERMRITTDGRIGIGTATPTTGMEITTGSIRATNTNGYGSLQIATTNENNIFFADSNVGTAYTGYLVGQSTSYGVGTNFSIGRVNAGTVVSTPPLSVSSNGTVGIGTGQPTNKFVVSDLSGSLVFDASTTTPRLSIRSTNYIPNPTPAGYPTSNAFAELSFENTNSSWNAAIRGINQGNGAYADRNRIGFFTMPARGDSTLYERLSITETGNIGIGTSVPEHLLDICGSGTGNTTTLRISSGLSGSASSANIPRLRLTSKVATGAILDYDITGEEAATANNYGLSFSGYNNTGVFRMDFGNKYFGIGTVTPGAALDISTSSSPYAVILRGNDVGVNSAVIGIQFSNRQGIGEIGIAGSNGNWAANSVSGDLVLRSSANKRILFNAHGTSLSNAGVAIFGSNLGIGTTTPQSRLTVAGDISASGTLLFTQTAGKKVNLYQNNGGGVIGLEVQNSESRYSTDAAATFQTFGYYNGSTFNERVRITSNNFGIGTTTPQSTLTVAGDISSSGAIYAQSNEYTVYITGAGTYTCNVPAGFTKAHVTLVGAGGGGGGGGISVNPGGGGGGGGAGYRIEQVLSSLPSQITISLGAGGTGGTTPTSIGNAGGNGFTGSASTISYTGLTSGTMRANGGNGGGGGGTNSGGAGAAGYYGGGGGGVQTGGTAGAGGTGVIQSGSAGTVGASTAGGAGGGGGGAVNGGVPDSSYRSGGGGGGGPVGGPGGDASIAGSPGTAGGPGCGGGGGAVGSTQGTAVGGRGGDGYCIIKYLR